MGLSVSSLACIVELSNALCVSNAWAPHQIMTWKAMERYGYKVEANRLAYRWCYMIVKAFVEEQGIVAEKLDAVAISHVVTAEYGVSLILSSSLPSLISCHSAEPRQC